MLVLRRGIKGIGIAGVEALGQAIGQREEYNEAVVSTQWVQTW